MNSVIGFSIFSNLPEGRVKALDDVQARALAHFSDLQKRSLVIGDTHLEMWGRGAMDERIHTLPDGSLAVVIGSPHGRVVLKDVQYDLLSNEFEIPWDGRVILLRVSADGKCWTMWNDWLGSIPVFHAALGESRLASTLEPVVVSGAGYTPKDFFLPGLVSLMINGHFLSDWTLYEGMRTVLPDSVAEWHDRGYRVQQVWSVQPSQSRWEAGWDDLIDEMHELSRRAIVDILKTQPSWTLPLSSGLDSRLIAGVAAEVGANVHSYAWGGSDTSDVAYSRQVAKTLELPWKHITLPEDFLVKYTPVWAAMFGSAMHFHGMYQMAFLDEIRQEPAGKVLSGFIGDVLAGDDVITLSKVHSSTGSCQIYNDWHVHWTVKDLPSLLRKPVSDILPELASAIDAQINAFSGSRFQNLLYLELWSRQRYFTNFQSTVSDYWRGVANPFMNRDYARFCMSLPRAALDNRRLLGDVFRRYYGPLAVIPGTYAKDPFILTGRYLVLRRLADKLPQSLHYGPLRGFGNVQLRLDVECIKALGKSALWPLFENLDKLAHWVDVSLLEQDYQTILRSKEDIRPLRRLQTAQTLTYRLVAQEDITQ